MHLSDLFAEVFNSFHQEVVLHGDHFFHEVGQGLKSTSPSVVEEVAVVNVWAWSVLDVIVILTPK
jgi:hypothetical protein